MSGPLTDKVLLIGWDAADWKIISPLLDDGAMPNLERFLSRGVMGNLSTLVPVLSPMLWTSIATGKRAFKHGVHGFSEPDPNTGGVRPISNLGRRTKAVWNILNQNGKRSNVIGWWPSHPVEPINGVMVSNHYQAAVKPLDEPWPLRPGTVHPQRLAKPLAQFRIHPWEIDAEQLLPFVPNAESIDQDKDRRLYSIAKVLAECASVQAAATAVMELEPWDFTAVYFDAIDHFCHGFMRYHPPRLAWIGEADYELYKDVVASAYRFHDMMLGAMMDLAGEQTTVIICSDHGFHPDHLRPRELPNEPAGPAEEHRPFGVFAMCGPGVKRDELVYGASLLDVTPTILSLFGLSVGRDMDGKALTTAFDRPVEVAYVDSWDTVEGDAGTHPPGRRTDPIGAADALQQLVDLGYIDAPSEDRAVATENTLRELRYNLARDYIDAGRPAQAVVMLESLWDQWPEESRFGVQLLTCMLTLERLDEAHRVLDMIRARKVRYAEQAREELRRIAEAQADEEDDELDRAEQTRRMRLRRRAQTNHGSLSYLEGRLYLAEGDAVKALASFERVGEVQMHNRPSLLYARAEAQLALERYADAEATYASMLDIDPVSAQARLGLCRALLGRRRPRRALEQALASIGLVYHNPQAHYLCGVANQWLGRVDDAVRAFEAAVAQNTVFPEAHRRLARLYRTKRKDPHRAAEHQKAAAEARRRLRAFRQGRDRPDRHAPLLPSRTVARLGAMGEPKALPPLSPDEIVIVSGLPRSGTSMMMQMLGAGGVEPLTDDARAADASNPRGYYEYAAVKSIAHDHAWIGQARGRAVKIVAPLLPRLPLGHRYRIIFMERDLRDVIQSQHTMLERLGRRGAEIGAEKLAATYLRQIEAVRELLTHHESTIEVMSVDYARALENPRDVAKQLDGFLGGGHDRAAMAAAIDPTLRHEHAA